MQDGGTEPDAQALGHLLGDADDAADLAQETFVKAYRALGNTRDDTNLSAWLHRIAYNVMVDRARRPASR